MQALVPVADSGSHCGGGLGSSDCTRRLCKVCECGWQYHTGDEEEFLDLLRSGHGSLRCWCNVTADSVPGSRFQKILIRYVQSLRVCLFSDLTSLKKPILEGEREEGKRRGIGVPTGLSGLRSSSASARARKVLGRTRPRPLV